MTENEQLTPSCTSMRSCLKERKKERKPVQINPPFNTDIEHTVAYNPALTRTCRKQQCSELGWLCPDEHVDWWDRSHTCKYKRRKQSPPQMDLLSSYCFHNQLWIKVWDISLPNIKSIDVEGIAQSTLPIYNINKVNPSTWKNSGSQSFPYKVKSIHCGSVKLPHFNSYNYENIPLNLLLTWT